MCYGRAGITVRMRIITPPAKLLNWRSSSCVRGEFEQEKRVSSLEEASAPEAKKRKIRGVECQMVTSLDCGTEFQASKRFMTKSFTELTSRPSYPLLLELLYY